MNKQNQLESKSADAPLLRSKRAGLSVLEFVGCLMALVGGIWLGAIYLGIDVQKTAYVALSESQLMDKVPEKWRPVDPAAKDAPSSAELTKQVQNELVALREEITSLRDSQQSQPTTLAEKTTSAATTDADQQARQASLAYWSRINEIVHRQATLQYEAESAATTDIAAKVATLKARISRFSADAIRALPAANVDPAALKLGNELATWYDNGADLYDQAVQVWESPARTQAGQPVTQEWDRMQVQHQNEQRLLESRVAAVRDSLIRRFGDGFAPLAGL
jgi:hypothetical protein